MLKLGNGRSFRMSEVLRGLPLLTYRIGCICTWLASSLRMASANTDGWSRCSWLGKVGIEAIVWNWRLNRPTAVQISLGRVRHAVGHMCHCRMMLQGLPTLAVMELHPIVFTILNLSCILQGLGEEFAEVVVIRGILESKIANIAEVFVEFL